MREKSQSNSLDNSVNKQGIGLKGAGDSSKDYNGKWPSTAALNLIYNSKNFVVSSLEPFVNFSL